MVDGDRMAAGYELSIVPCCVTPPFEPAQYATKYIAEDDEEKIGCEVVDRDCGARLAGSTASTVRMLSFHELDITELLQS